MFLYLILCYINKRICKQTGIVKKLIQLTWSVFIFREVSTTKLYHIDFIILIEKVNNSVRYKTMNPYDKKGE